MDNKDKCDFTIEQRRRIVKQGTNKLFCTEFVVKNVTATCEYHCAFSNARVTKTVVVKGKYNDIASYVYNTCSFCIS